MVSLQWISRPSGFWQQFNRKHHTSRGLQAATGRYRLEPTGGKLGSLPLASATLQGVVNRLFNSPENKEKFRLPPYIHDIQIQHGQIVISSRQVFQ